MSVKSISDLKVKAIEFEREHRIVPKVMGAVTALTVCAVPASAEETASTVDISSVTTSMTSELTSLVGKVGVACAGVVGAGLTIFGLKWAVTKVMAFFKAIGK